MDRIKTLHIFLIIAAIGIIVYANSFQNEFVWDDDYLVLYNTQVQDPSLKNALDLFGHNLAKHGQDVTSFYRPIQELSYMMDFSIWGFEAVGYHLTSLLLHIGVAFVLFLIAAQLSKDRITGLVASVLYLVHPLHTEAVTYIAGRADSLAALFALLAFYLYAMHRTLETKPERVTYVTLSSLSFVCALLSRENALILPALLLFYELTFVTEEKWKARIPRLLPFFSLTAIYGALRLTVLNFGHPVARIPEDVGFYERVLTFFRAFAGYVRLIFVPLDLHMERNPLYSRSILDPKVLVSVVLLAIVIGVTILLRKRRTLVHFGLGWFLITLFPSSNIPFVLNAPMAEHWLYIPLMGIAVTGASLLTSAARALSKKEMTGDVLACVAAAAITVYFSVLTVIQNRTWHDNETLYTYTLQYGESPRVRYNLANTYRETGRFLDAIKGYEMVLTMDPSFYSAHFNLGLTYGALRDLDRAIAKFQQTLVLKKDHPGAYSAMGTAFMMKEMPEKAIECYTRAVEIKPDSKEVWYALGNVYSRQKQHDRAEKAFRRLAELDPGSHHVWNTLAECLRRQGKTKEAVETWKKSLEINPGQLTIRRMLEQIESPAAQPEGSSP
ncbi:tetratricopeptide repeat protein [Planctomycetota bacterium]